LIPASVPSVKFSLSSKWIRPSSNEKFIELFQREYVFNWKN
jgi:hypothetical protein